MNDDRTNASALLPQRGATCAAQASNCRQRRRCSRRWRPPATSAGAAGAERRKSRAGTQQAASRRDAAGASRQRRRRSSSETAPPRPRKPAADAPLEFNDAGRREGRRLASLKPSSSRIAKEPRPEERRRAEARRPLCLADERAQREGRPTHAFRRAAGRVEGRGSRRTPRSAARTSTPRSLVEVNRFFKRASTRTAPSGRSIAAARSREPSRPREAWPSAPRSS
jgi:hypothetical protein